MNPNTPVIVGTGQLSNRDDAAEPVDLMVRASEKALADTSTPLLRKHITSMRVVRGIWPYRDPGAFVADLLGLTGASTALTQLGGNGVYDVFNETAASIQSGDLDAALICSAETMRSRRRAKAAGRRSVYLDERADAAPDLTLGSDRELADRVDFEAEMHQPVNFYAMVESAIRHRRGESIGGHRARIAALWAVGSEIASTNPHAWTRNAVTADEIATPAAQNRMVADPYTKLMTSNIDVDQAAAIVVCSASVARAAGVPLDRWVFPRSGSGAYDHWVPRTRWALDESPAMRASGTRAIELAGVSIGDFDLLDLYSCFPSAVQLAQRELGIEEARPFTLTGGLTFAGGPYNSYCMHALARCVELLREHSGTLALLNGNGGFFTKHSFTTLGGTPGAPPFGYDRPQAEVDARPIRAEAVELPLYGEIEAYTVTYGRDGLGARGLLSVLDEADARTWAVTEDPASIRSLVDSDRVGSRATLEATAASPIAHLDD